MKRSRDCGMRLAWAGFLIASTLVMGTARADFVFGLRMDLRSTIPVLDGSTDIVNCFSYDGLEMYVDSLRAGGYRDWGLWVSKRTSPDADWGPLESLGPVFNTQGTDSSASISADGLTLYFTSDRAGGYGRHDIYMASRVSPDDPWGQGVNMGPEINSSTSDLCPWISVDGLELYFASWDRPGGYGGSDIYVVKRTAPDAGWGEAVNLGPVVNSPYQEHAPSLSPDGLVLLFAERESFRDAPRPGGYGAPDIWMAKRADLSSPWKSPVNLGPSINTPEGEYAPHITPDGRTLHFCADHPYENYQASIVPAVDFNGDEAVDAADIEIMIDCWGTDEPLCDIGPFPWGDGVVDVEDLIVLAEHIVAARTDSGNTDAVE